MKLPLTPEDEALPLKRIFATPSDVVIAWEAMVGAGVGCQIGDTPFIEREYDLTRSPAALFAR